MLLDCVDYDETSRLESCSRDPVGLRAGINYVRYVDSTPLMRLDPFGHFSMDPTVEDPGEHLIDLCNRIVQSLDHYEFLTDEERWGKRCGAGNISPPVIRCIDCAPIAGFPAHDKDSYQGGSFGCLGKEKGTFKTEILVCANGLVGLNGDEMERAIDKVLRHEGVHFFDACNSCGCSVFSSVNERNTDKNRCKQLLCSEIRAYIYSGQLDTEFEGDFDRLKEHIWDFYVTTGNFRRICLGITRDEFDRLADQCSFKRTGNLPDMPEIPDSR